MGEPKTLSLPSTRYAGCHDINSKDLYFCGRLHEPCGVRDFFFNQTNMIMKSRFLTALALMGIVFLASCSQFSQNQLVEQQATWDKMMAIHDEVMPQMGAINETSNALKARLEGETDDMMRQQIVLGMKTLEAAEDGMFVWMKDLKQLEALRETQTHDQIMEYLKGQLTLVERVRDNMLKSIQDGQAILAAVPAEEI